MYVQFEKPKKYLNCCCLLTGLLCEMIQAIVLTLCNLLFSGSIEGQGVVLIFLSFTVYAFFALINPNIFPVFCFWSIIYFLCFFLFCLCVAYNILHLCVLFFFCLLPFLRVTDNSYAFLLLLSYTAILSAVTFLRWVYFPCFK